MNEFRRWLARRQLTVSVAVLVLLAYLPALTAAPGRMPSDSKLYVYLDPARFLADTTTTFDPRQFAGWVPHQHIAYLWPMGPWFWFFDAIGVPDWVAHRLWVGTLLVAAGLGVRWVARLLGLGPTAALVAAIVYQLSPYILPYVSRTSILLLPYAGLGWIVGLTVLAAQRGRWRFAAGVALVVLTVGAVNATALAMIIPAPTLWLVHAVWQRSITWRRALATAAKVAVLSLAVSLWWIAMLLIQGKRGADVLAYSESLESVSFTSTSTEVLRGLGYWLFYIRDVFGATTTASLDYLASVRVMVVRRRPARRGAVRPGVHHLAASALRRPADRIGARARRRRPSDRRSFSADVGPPRRRRGRAGAGAAQQHAGRAGARVRVGPERGVTRGGVRVDSSAQPSGLALNLVMAARSVPSWSPCSLSVISRRCATAGSSIRNSNATRIRRRRGSTPRRTSTRCPPATASCSCPVASSVRSAGGTRSTSRCRP